MSLIGLVSLNVSAHSDFPGVGVTINPGIGYSTRDGLGYGADAHISVVYLNGSAEYFLWNHPASGDTATWRGYLGIGLCAQLMQLQVGFGDGKPSYKFRSNLNMRGFFGTSDRSTSWVEALLYPDRHARTHSLWTPILSLSAELTPDTQRYGVNIGVLVW